MKRGTITALLGGAIVAGFSLGAFAEVNENPYQVIIDRNPFGLRPIPPPPSTEAPPPPPPPALEIKLTGITTLLGPARVFLEFTDPQTKKTDRPPPFSEGDPYKDGISIVSIDAENGKVRIRNGDAETTLDFEKNGIKPGGATVAAVAQPVAGVGQPFGGVPTAGMPAVPAAAGPARGSIVGGASAPAPVGAPGAFNPNLSALPPRPLRTDGASIVGGYGQTAVPQPQTVPTQPTMTREQAEATIELRRQELMRSGSPGAAILPPTRLGNALGQPPSQFPNQVPTPTR